MHTDTQKKYMAVVQEICRPEPAAYIWFCQALEAALLWDHTIDGDPIDKRQADWTFERLVLGWVTNDWFVKSRGCLVPIMNGCVQEWRNNQGPGKRAAYLLYTQLPAALAFLLHGYDGKRFMPEIYRLVEEERFEDVRRDHAPFIIMSLPRSRTAWLAAFLTDGDVTCHHELLRVCESPEEYPDKFLQTKTPIIGDADPSMVLFYEGLRDKLPPHKVVFINRDPVAAEQSHRAMLEKTGHKEAQGIDAWLKVEIAFNAVKRLVPDAMTFQFEDLDDEKKVQQLAEYCTGLPFNRERYRQFNELNIECIPSKVLEGTKLIK